MVALESVVRVSEVEIRYWSVLRNGEKSSPLKVPVKVAVDWDTFKRFLAKRGIYLPDAARNSWEKEILPKVQMLAEFEG